jgi:hypothetical protein
MSNTLRSPEGFSVFVEAYLLVGDRRIAVEQVCGSMITLRDDVELAPATSATLVMVIEDQVTEQPILLTEGNPLGRQPVPYF